MAALQDAARISQRLVEVALPIRASWYRAVILADSPVGYWRLGDQASTTAVDETGNTSASYFGSIVYNVPGALFADPNSAVTMDGSTTSMRVTSTAVLDVGDGPMSAEIWFKRTSTLGTFQKLYHKGNTAWGLGFNTTDHIAFDAIGTTHTTSTGTYGNDGIWHHLVATKNGTARKIWVDAVDVTNLGTNATAANNATNLQVGRNNGGSEFFSGSVDEAALYNTVLSSAQVFAHYVAGRGGPVGGGITQDVIEVAIANSGAAGHLSQRVVEVAVANSGARGRVSQDVIEVAIPTTVPF